MIKLEIIGNLTKDPSRRIVGENTVVDFDVACNEGKYKTEFVHCQAWNKIGDVVINYASKGKKIYARGDFTSHDYTANDGANKRAYTLNVRDIELLSPRSEETKTAEIPASIPDDEELPF